MARRHDEPRAAESDRVSASKVTDGIAPAGGAPEPWQSAVRHGRPHAVSGRYEPRSMDGSYFYTRIGLRGPQRDCESVDSCWRCAFDFDSAARSPEPLFALQPEVPTALPLSQFGSLPWAIGEDKGRRVKKKEMSWTSE